MRWTPLADQMVSRSCRMLIPQPFYVRTPPYVHEPFNVN